MIPATFTDDLLLLLVLVTGLCLLFAVGGLIEWAVNWYRNRG